MDYNKQFIKMFASYTFVGIVGIVFGMLITMPSAAKRHAEDYNHELLRAYDAYNVSVETLLDSMAIADEDFADTWCETDTYCEYAIARERVDNIINGAY